MKQHHSIPLVLTTLCAFIVFACEAPSRDAGDEQTETGTAATVQTEETADTNVIGEKKGDTNIAEEAAPSPTPSKEELEPAKEKTTSASSRRKTDTKASSATSKKEYSSSKKTETASTSKKAEPKAEYDEVDEVSFDNLEPTESETSEKKARASWSTLSELVHVLKTRGKGGSVQYITRIIADGMWARPISEIEAERKALGVREIVIYYEKSTKVSMAILELSSAGVSKAAAKEKMIDVLEEVMSSSYMDSAVEAKISSTQKRGRFFLFNMCGCPYVKSAHIYDLF